MSFRRRFDVRETVAGVHGGVLTADAPLGEAKAYAGEKIVLTLKAAGAVAVKIWRSPVDPADAGEELPDLDGFELVEGDATNGLNVPFANGSVGFWWPERVSGPASIAWAVGGPAAASPARREG